MNSLLTLHTIIISTQNIFIYIILVNFIKIKLTLSEFKVHICVETVHDSTLIITIRKGNILCIVFSPQIIYLKCENSVYYMLWNKGSGNSLYDKFKFF